MSKTSYVQECMNVIAPYINGTANTCSYCERLNPLILADGQHTYITLAIGQIVEGYLQLCTHKHRTACTGLYEFETGEFLIMKRVIRTAFEIVYGTKGIAFEHGKAGSCLWGERYIENMTDLCHHTHVHFVPVDIDIRSNIRKILPREIIINNINELKTFREKELFGDAYLYFEDVHEVGYVYPVENIDIPRQFLRRCVADKLGLVERTDWITFPGEEYFLGGKEKLQQILQDLVNERVHQ